jgi:peptidoglycan/LPS O-acetylase OafA/YrhL
MTEARTKARSSQHTADDTQRLGIAAALVLAVVTALGLYTLVSAPAIREAARAELARVIADEDRDVCGQFGLHPGTDAFVVCSRELANVRRKQSDRDQATAAGML